MKKFAFIFLCLLASTPVFAKDPTFDEQLEQAAIKLSESLDGKIESCAVMGVNCQWWALSDYIMQTLEYHLLENLGAGNVVSRDEFTDSLVASEIEYGSTGVVSDDTIQEWGEILGVDCIIHGEVSDVSSGYQIIIKATQTNTKKQLASWKGTVKSKDKDVKYLIDKSNKSPRPTVQASTTQTSKSTGTNAISVSAVMINSNGQEVTVLHPGDIIRFKITSDTNAYLAILCIDAQKEESWLPLQNNYIRAGESRIFPDIAGAVLRVQDGIFGNEQVIVYAATVETDLPTQGKSMGTRAFSLAREDAATAQATINYKVSR